jgi:beta-phosphoglucomutase-like phosphatase (HAD superfamily)
MFPDYPDNTPFDMLSPHAAAVVEQAKRKALKELTVEQLDSILDKAKTSQLTWDFDGVLADNEPLQWKTFEVLGSERGFIPPLGYARELMGKQEKDIWQGLFGMGFPEDDVPYLITLRGSLYRRLAVEELESSWLAAQLVPLFYKHGVSQHVVSNGQAVNNQAILDVWGYSRMFDSLNEGDKRNRLTGFHSHNPGVVFEDNAGYLQHAKALGCLTVSVTHTYLKRTEPGDVNMYIGNL